MKFALLTLTFLACLAPHAVADVKLPQMLSDHMVMQRDVAVPLWGTADANRDITLKLDDKIVAKGKSAPDGQWQLKLPPTPAGGHHSITIEQDGGKSAEITDILFGEVWICSGQSNMEMPMNNCQGVRDDLLAANHPRIRLLIAPHNAIGTPQRDVAASWKICTPETAREFSAAAYFFGVELLGELDVPIGLIDTSWGATSGEPWTSREAMLAEKDFIGAVRSGDDVSRGFENGTAKIQFEKQLAEWNEAAARAKADNKPEPPNKPYYSDFRTNPSRPANLFNGMIAPFAQMPVAGAIWYQGESNVGRGAEYRVLLPTLIRSWRTAWGRDDLPFYFVQIAPYHYGDPLGAPCAELWESQLLTMKSVSHTGMAVISDVTDLKNIHPNDKKTVGHRLALWALAKTYGKDVAYSGPIYTSIKIEDGKIRISFDHTDGGLESRDGKPLDWFTIAGDDLKFEPAEATIDGNTVVVHSDKVPHPTAVRFGWNEAATPNLMNHAKLPAAPFRTDNAPMVTTGKLW